MSRQAAARARVLFDGGFCCAESVLKAASEALGVECDGIPRIATGLCGGVSRTGELCGALLGGILAIGLGLGKKRPHDSADPAYEAVRSLIDSFRDAFGSTTCPELCGFDLDTPEGQIRFAETNQHERCSRYVATATERALEEIEAREPAD